MVCPLREEGQEWQAQEPWLQHFQASGACQAWPSRVLQEEEEIALALTFSMIP